MSRLLSHICVLCLLIGCPALTATADATERYVVTFKQENVDAEAATQLIEDSGAELIRGHFNAGIAVVESDDPAFVAQIESDSSVDSCFLDSVQVGGVDDPQLADLDMLTAGVDEDSVSLPTYLLGGADALVGTRNGGRDLMDRDPTQVPGFFFQWNLVQIKMPELWELGKFGDPSVEIAVVSTGLDYTHPELVGKVDLSRSVSLLPDEDLLLQQLFPGAHPIADLNWIGTFDAGLAACNIVNTACVAPDSTLIGVKAMDKDFLYQFGDLISGILVAADLNVDVILVGAAFDTTLQKNDSEDKKIIGALRRAVTRGYQSGALVLTEAGLGPLQGGVQVGIDADNDPPLQMIFPQDASARLLVVGDNGPEFEKLPNSNFGATLIDVSAPGGRQVPPFPLTDFIIAPCSSFSTRIPDCRDFAPRYLFSLSSHPSAGQAAGLGALIDAEVGGALRGEQLRSIIIETTDDIGEPGIDPLFGRGLINALRAVTEGIDDDDEDD